MKISDLIFQTPRSGHWRGSRPGICRVRTFASAANGVVALLTDLGEKNTGQSVTNSIERICRELIDRGVVDASATFIQHYEASGYRPATFDIVSFRTDGSPVWKKISVQEAAEFLGTTLAELSAETLKDERLNSEIERLRNTIDPFIDSPYPEDPEVINRREAIRDRMISKRELANLVCAGAIERELQALLKRDLSVFGEVYADPQESYICFSEFPVGDGKVDFVVFTGTSRMDVILIEVKGADFALVNRGSYRNFASKINEAAQQMRSRFRAIYQNLPDFRARVHSIRQAVESGTPVHNSLLGPEGPLEVDPEKDIYIRCVLIGGRCRNDLEESRLRHDFEWNTKPPVKLESWDSWLKKIRRD